MGLNSSTLLLGATCSATGGVSHSFTPDGLMISNGLHLIDAAITDYRTRPSITVKTKQPTLLPDGTWGRGKRSMTITLPKVLSSGKQEFPNVRIELSDHPEMSQAEIDALTCYAAQSLFDADFLAFWRTGSQA